jgi:hypothetical protein
MSRRERRIPRKNACHIIDRVQLPTHQPKFAAEALLISASFTYFKTIQNIGKPIKICPSMFVGTDLMDLVYTR